MATTLGCLLVAYGVFAYAGELGVSGTVDSDWFDPGDLAEAWFGEALAPRVRGAMF